MRRKDIQNRKKNTQTPIIKAGKWFAKKDLKIKLISVKCDNLFLLMRHGRIRKCK